VTPVESLEKTVQFIKGGFSFRAKKELEWRGDIWVTGFSDHRVRDCEDYDIHRQYIERNAVKARIVEHAQDYAWCSASGRFEMDAIPRGLKPIFVAGLNGATKVAPFQSRSAQAKAAPIQDNRLESE
jgi:putative transposase